MLNSHSRSPVRIEFESKEERKIENCEYFQVYFLGCSHISEH